MQQSFYRNPRSFTIVLVRRAVIASIFYCLLIRYHAFLFRGDMFLAGYVIAGFALAFTLGVIGTALVLLRIHKPAIIITADDITIQQQFGYRALRWENAVDVGYRPIHHTKLFKHDENGRRHSEIYAVPLPHTGKPIYMTDLDRFTVSDTLIGKALEEAFTGYTQAHPQENFDEKKFFKGYDEAKLHNSQRYVGRSGVKYYDYDADDAARYIYKRAPKLGIRMISQFIQLKSDYLTTTPDELGDADLTGFIQQQYPEWPRATIEKLDVLEQGYVELVGIARQMRR